MILSGALKRAVRWRWLSTNPIEHAEPPPQPAANPQPPSPEEAARILNEAWSDPDWAVLVWLTMVTGFRRGELCALRWNDLDVVGGVLSVERSIGQLAGQTWEKDTKTHQHRRIALDQETLTLLAGHRERCMADAAALGIELPPDAYMFSSAPDGRPTSSRARSASAMRGWPAARHQDDDPQAAPLLGDRADLRRVDVRTVAGRLGHGGGGTTTLRVYAAWVSEADQRASEGLLSSTAGATDQRARHARCGERALRGVQYEVVAAELRAQILNGRPATGVPAAKPEGDRSDVQRRGRDREPRGRPA